MGRAPCCEKMGIKKGPWTKEEDLVLISYINQHGHQNWRALPKKAGLLRCGKSCRLRWINYLRPDIKRGNFSKEEEDTIIQLHQLLGNRWSAIAAKLPGRTDNEIKNVWHTHLKKRLNHHPAKSDHGSTGTDDGDGDGDDSSTISLPESSGSRFQCQPNSPSHSTSSLSTSSSSSSSTTMTAATTNIPVKKSIDACLDNNEEDFSWLDGVVSSSGNSGLFLPVLSPLRGVDNMYSSYNANLEGDMEFWSDLFTRADESLHLPEF